MHIGSVDVPEDAISAGQNAVLGYVVQALAQRGQHIQDSRRKVLATPAAQPPDRKAHTGGAGKARPERQQRPTEWTPAAIEKLRRGEIVGGFAGPNQTFPLAGTGDLRAAWKQSETDPNRERVRWAILAMAAVCRWFIPPEFIEGVAA